MKKHDFSFDLLLNINSIINRTQVNRFFYFMTQPDFIKSVDKIIMVAHCGRIEEKQLKNVVYFFPSLTRF
jgi:hypothetical protein